MVRVYLTGRVLIEGASATIEEREFGGRQGRLLLAHLVLERTRPSPLDELIDLLWVEQPPAAAHVALRALVSRLRGALDRGGLPRQTLTTLSGCLQIHLPAHTTWVDFEAAASAVDAAEGRLRQGDPMGAFPFATTASAISSRDFLPGEPAAWVVGRQAQLRNIRIRALEAITDVFCRVRQWPVAVKVAQDLVTLEPLRETGYGWLMRAQVGAGNRAEALQTYDRCRRVLAEELGVSPSGELAGLHEQVLRGLAHRI